MGRGWTGRDPGPRSVGLALLAGALTLVATYVVSAHLNFFERFAAWSEGHESLQVDEVAMVAAVGLVVSVIAVVVWSRRTTTMARRLASANEQYRSLFEYHPHGVFSIGLDGRFQSANAAAERMWGWSEAELRQRDFLDMVHPDSRESVMAGFAVLLERRPSHLEAVIKHRRGRLATLSMTGLPIVVRHRVVGVYGIARDVTKQNGVLRELKRANLAAARASDAKAAFLATISHEIRTPLTSLLTASELLADTDLDPLQEDVVARIGRSGRRLQRLVDDVLDFSKLEAGKVELEAVDVQVREIVEDVAAMFVPAAERKGVLVHHVVAPDVPEVLIGDPGRIAQVLNNLVGNAVKFTSEGSVTIGVSVATLEEDEVHLRFEVRDTGIGMTAEQQGRLFQSFSQADPSITRRYGGTGLGLVISRTLVSLMGGTITATGEEGAGSTFAFRVRLSRPSLDDDLARLQSAGHVSDHTW